MSGAITNLYMLEELYYLFCVIARYIHPKLVFRGMICHWYRTGNDIVAPKEIYEAIEKYDAETAQKLLDKQCEFWGSDDPAIMRAQSYIDLLE